MPTEADIFERAEEMAKELAQKMHLEKLTVLERQLDASFLNESQLTTENSSLSGKLEETQLSLDNALAGLAEMR